jgi:hypothetical protein
MSRSLLITTGIVAVGLLAEFALPIVRARNIDKFMQGTALPVRSSSDGARMPVVVELFTSEGCSDCPPADTLLEKLDRSQPVANAQVIVLSEHVDYWDDIGWRDPFSSHAYSERQNEYASHFGLGGVYTPQMVVDGRIQFVGSDERGALHAIESAARAQKIPVTLSVARFDGNNVTLRLETGPAPTDAALLVAIEDESDVSSVSRGENSGRTLKHVAVVREMTQVGTVAHGQNFAKDVTVKFTRNNNPNYRVVALLQDPSSGAILGAGSARLQN